MSEAQVHTWFHLGEISSLRRYCILPVFGLLPAVTFTFDLWPRKLISTSANPRTSVAKIGWISLHWFLRYGFLDAQTHSRTHARTHSLTVTDRPNYTMPPAPFFNGGGCIKIQNYFLQRDAYMMLCFYPNVTTVRSGFFLSQIRLSVVCLPVTFMHPTHGV